MQIINNTKQRHEESQILISEESERDYTPELLQVIEYLEQEGAKRELEEVLKDALDKVKEPFPRWVILINLAGFYFSNDMYLNLKKVCKQLVKEYPDNYAGYHLYLYSEVGRGKYKKAKDYMMNIPDDLSNHPQYYVDFISLLEHSDSVDEALEFIDSHSEVMDIVPEYALRKKIELKMKKDETDEIESILETLSEEYGDLDAVIALMILHFQRGEYIESGVLAKLVLDEDKDNRSYRSYLAYFFQISNLYILSDRHPDGKALAWIQNAIQWIKDYLKENQFDDPEVNQLIQEIEQAIPVK